MLLDKNCEVLHKNKKSLQTKQVKIKNINGYRSLLQ